MGGIDRENIKDTISKNIVPDLALQIDGFHVMQELNWGINKDLKSYATVIFNDEIRDLIYIRKILNKIRSALRNKTPTNLIGSRT
ncbi:MAG: hypothetical protein ACTSPQ_18930 [Candidatus Helarchaeota archaeon]